MSRGCVSVDRRANRPEYNGESSTSAGACVVWPSNRRIGGTAWAWCSLEFATAGVSRSEEDGGGGNAIIRGPFVVLVVSLKVSGEVLDMGIRVMVDIRALREFSHLS